MLRKEPKEQKGLSSLARMVQSGFDGVGGQFETMNKRFDIIDNKFDQVDKEFRIVNHKIDTFTRRIDAMVDYNRRIARLEKLVDSLLKR